MFSFKNNVFDGINVVILRCDEYRQILSKSIFYKCYTTIIYNLLDLGPCKISMMENHTIQYNTIQYNTIQYSILN